MGPYCEALLLLLHLCFDDNLAPFFFFFFHQLLITVIVVIQRIQNVKIDVFYTSNENSGAMDVLNCP